MVERIEDAAGFERLREEWDELLQASPSNCLFLTWEWFYTWWKHLAGHRKLFLLTVRSGRELVAIAPLALRPPSVTRLLPFRSLVFLGTGSVGSDYLDVIVRAGREREAARALADYLAARKLVIEFAQVNRSSCFAAPVAGELRQQGWRIAETKTDVCPFINLSGLSWPAYLATLGREHRYNFQRRLRNLTKQFDVRFEEVRSEEERREALAVLMALHDTRWRERGGSDAFHTRALRAFHEDLSRLALGRGWLRLLTLRLDGKPVASLYGFRYGRTFSFYQSGFDPQYRRHSVGLVSMGLAIKSAIEEGAEEYDLLHGDEQYKFSWARETRELGRLELYPADPRGLLYQGVARLGGAARKMARRMLPQAIADRIARGAEIGVWERLQATAPR